jgi:lipid-binding SYLF domain-containing protein
VPSFFKGGFVVGAAYGSALLLVRDETGAFSQPAFLEMSAGSLGFQAGAQDNRIMLMVMTDAGLQAILKDRFKMEAGASLTFGIFGGGLATGSTTDVNQDIVAFSHSRGLFAGGAFEGAVMEPRPDWNAAYYDAPAVTPEAIVFERRVANPASTPLIEALQAPAPGGG